jgi:hypothetical protein
VIQKPIFNEDNVNALLSHLVPGSLAQELVAAIGTAASKDEATAILAAVLESRIAGIREALDADS